MTLNVDTRSESGIPRGFSLGGAHGINANLGMSELGYIIHDGVVSTSEVGREFLERDATVRWLLNEIAEIDKNGGQTLHPPLALSLAQRYGKLHIANFGCGGCSTVPLIHDLVREVASSGGAPIDVSFDNYDLSGDVVAFVQQGLHPHYMSSPGERGGGSFFDLRWTHRLERYMSESFDPIEGMLEIDRPGDRVNAERVAAFVMKKERISALTVEHGDIRDIPLPDASRHIVMCFNVAVYLDEAGVHKAYKEVERVLVEGGAFLSNGALHRKLNGVLSLVSGIGVEKGGTACELSEGLHPTRVSDGGVVVTPVRVVRGRRIRPEPFETFIGGQNSPLPRLVDDLEQAG